MKKYFYLIMLCLLLTSCTYLKFSGVEWEISVGNERGNDQDVTTNKMDYGTLVRFKWDYNKPENKSVDRKEGNKKEK